MSQYTFLKKLVKISDKHPEEVVDPLLARFIMNNILSDVIRDKDSCALRYCNDQGTGNQNQESNSTTTQLQRNLTNLGSMVSELLTEVNTPQSAQSAQSPSAFPPLAAMAPNPQQAQNNSQQLAELLLLARELIPKAKPSAFRGITRRKKRWEAHVWRHGKQQYLGGYKEEERAARAYDMAVIKIRGTEGDTNFPSSEYTEELKRMRADELSVDDFILTLREEAKKRSRQLKEEEEDKRIAMLKNLNSTEALTEYLDKKEPSSTTVFATGSAKRERSLPLARAASESASVQQMELYRKMNTEAILDDYLEMAKSTKRQKKEHQALSQQPTQLLSSISALLQSAAAAQQSHQRQSPPPALSSQATLQEFQQQMQIQAQQAPAMSAAAESMLLAQQQQQANLLLQALQQQQAMQLLQNTGELGHPSAALQKSTMTAPSTRPLISQTLGRAGSAPAQVLSPSEEYSPPALSETSSITLSRSP